MFELYFVSPQTTLEANVKRKIRDLMTENNAYTPAFYILGFSRLRAYINFFMENVGGTGLEATGNYKCY